MSTHPDFHRRPANYEDLKGVPDHLVAELVDGELIVSPRPALPHAQASSVIGSDLLSAFHRRAGGPGGPGGWWILDEPELHFGRDVLVPDLAGWRRERLPRVPDEAFMTLAPDWVCEVVSPSTVRLDRVRKTHVYAREGVRHLWLVDPIARTVEVYRLEGEHYSLQGVLTDEPTARIEPFETVALYLPRWWGEDGEPPEEAPAD